MPQAQLQSQALSLIRNPAQPSKSAHFGQQQAQSDLDPTDADTPGATPTPNQKQDGSNNIGNALMVVATAIMAMATVALAVFNRKLVTVTNNMTDATRALFRVHVAR